MGNRKIKQAFKLRKVSSKNKVTIDLGFSFKVKMNC